MKTSLKFWPRIVLALAFACATMPGFAQPGKLELKNLDKLADKASEVNDVTLDQNLLQMAAKMIQKEGDREEAQAKDLIKNLKGIYVKSFEFEKPNQYSQADVQSIRSQLTGPGWQRIVQSMEKKSGELSEIYLLKQGEQIQGMAILVAEPLELTVVNIVGPIDPEKLGELGGQFGIPNDIGGSSGTKPQLKPRTESPKQGTEKKEAPRDQKK